MKRPKPQSKILVNDRKLLLWGDINESISYKIIKALKILYKKDPTKPIKLYIHTDGGEVESGMTIVDEIRGIISCGGEVWTIAQGKAYSMGGIILAMGSQRYATPNSCIMLHPFSQDTDSDTIGQIKKSIDFTHKYQESILKLVAEACDKTGPVKFKKFRDDIEKTLWMTAAEAKKYGIIDDIWQYEWETEDKETNDS